jgi:hypothetical protein
MPHWTHQPPLRCEISEFFSSLLVGRSLCLPDLRIRGAKSRGLLPFLKAQPIRRRGVAVPLRQILLRIEVQQHCQQEKRTDFIEKVSKKLLTAKTVCC